MPPVAQLPDFNYSITRLPNYPILRSSAGSHELEYLQQIESGVAHHWCRDRAASQVDDPPEGTEQGGGDHRIDALDQVPGSKRQAGDDDSDAGTAERAFESAEQERALELLADAAGHDDKPCEHERLTWRL